MECLKYQYAIIFISTFFIAVEIAGNFYRIHNGYNNEMKPDQKQTRVKAIVECYKLCSTNVHCKRFGYVSDDKRNPYMSGTCHQFDTALFEDNNEAYNEKMILFKPFEDHVRENDKEESSVTSTLSSTHSPTSLMTTSSEQIQTEEVKTTSPEQIQTEEVTTTSPEQIQTEEVTTTTSEQIQTEEVKTTSEQIQTEEVTTTMETTTADPRVPNICFTTCQGRSNWRIRTIFNLSNGEDMKLYCYCAYSDRLVIFRGDTYLNGFINEDKILNGYDTEDYSNYWIGKQNFSRLIKEMVFDQVCICEYGLNEETCNIVNISVDANKFQVDGSCRISETVPFKFGTWSKCIDNTWWWGCNPTSSKSVFNNSPPGRYELFLI